jgi:hypothetical protein
VVLACCCGKGAAAAEQNVVEVLLLLLRLRRLWHDQARSRAATATATAELGLWVEVWVRRLFHPKRFVLRQTIRPVEESAVRKSGSARGHIKATKLRATHSTAELVIRGMFVDNPGFILARWREVIKRTNRDVTTSDQRSEATSVRALRRPPRAQPLPSG